MEAWSRSRCRRRFLVGDGGGDDRRAENERTARSLGSRKKEWYSYNLLLSCRCSDMYYLV
jgi:hypothetical protein